MPLTKLDTTAALIVIDLQKGIVGLPTVHPLSARSSAELPSSRALSATAACRWFSSTSQAGLRAAPMPDLPSLRFRRIGPSLFLSWSSNPATAS